MAYIIMGIILCALAIACAVYASFTIRCKGPLLSNPWLFASETERKKLMEKVDIKAEYRQLSIVFICVGAAFGYLGVSSFLAWSLPMYPVWVIAAIVVVYAIGSSIKFAMRQK